MTTPRLTGYPVDDALRLRVESDRRRRRDRRKAERPSHHWFGWLIRARP